MKNEFLFVIDLLTHGCTGVPYKTIEDSLKDGSFQVWNENRIKKAYNFGNGTMQDFLNRRKQNKQIVLTESDFIKKYPEYYNKYEDAINEGKKFCNEL